MPELPEVETIRRGIERHLLGRELVSLVRTTARAARRDPYPLALALPQSAHVSEVARRGKFLWLNFQVGDKALTDTVVVHLGMSGQLLVLTPSSAPATLADRAAERHVAATGEFAGGVRLVFADQRTFGYLALCPLLPTPDGAPAGAGTSLPLIPALAAHIARDPLDTHSAPAESLARIGATPSAIKRVLLDQRYLSGVGNIYADEALWRARLHPLTPASRIPPDRLEELLCGIVGVLGEALAQGGTSFDALYVDADGNAGYFERELAVYGRQGAPCRRCGAVIERSVVAGRGSHWCPVCQRPPSA